jgi:hypothetical protein
MFTAIPLPGTTSARANRRNLALIRQGFDLRDLVYATATMEAVGITGLRAPILTQGL